MDKTSLEHIVYIDNTNYLDDKSDYTYQPQNLVLELISLSKKIEFAILDYKFYPTIEQIDNNYSSNQLTSNNIFIPRIEGTYFALKFKIEIDKQIHIKEASKLKDYNKESTSTNFDYHKHTTFIFFDYFIREIDNLLIICNLAHPGSLYTLTGLGYFNNNPTICNFQTRNHHLEHIQFSKNTSWPKLDNIDIIKCWAWYTNNRGIFTGEQNSNLCRAASAYSLTLGEQCRLNEHITLLWSMIGIESLFKSSNTANLQSIRSQLKLNIGSMLGTYSLSSKIINSMYEIRSNFLHGGLNFPGLGHVAHENSRLEKNRREIKETISASICILTSALQYIIKHELCDIHFNYKVTISEKPHI